MTDQPDTPKGWVRREDGILEHVPGIFYRRGHHDEAVMMWWNGERRLGCTAIAYSHSRDVSGHMCGKTAKYDPDHNGNPTKCGIHCKAAKEKRQAKSEARYEAKKKIWARQGEQANLRKEAVEIVRRIADGHNDPRSLCVDWCARMDATKTPK